MKINLEAAELGEISDIHTKLLRVSTNYENHRLQSLLLLAELDLNFLSKIGISKTHQRK